MFLIAWDDVCIALLIRPGCAIHCQQAFTADNNCPLFRMGMLWEMDFFFRTDEVDRACRRMVHANRQPFYTIVTLWNMADDFWKTDIWILLLSRFLVFFN